MSKCCLHTPHFSCLVLFRQHNATQLAMSRCAAYMLVVSMLVDGGGASCMCSSSYPYCAHTDSWCYESSMSYSYDATCRGDCTSSYTPPPPPPCSCPFDFPYCAGNSYCYRSSTSYSYTSTCEGFCTSDAPHCTCPSSHHYCATIDGYCYRSSALTSSHSNVCGGSCDVHGPAPECTCPQDFPYCASFDAHCYRSSAPGADWTLTCEGTCTAPAPHCTCPEDHYYCSTSDGFCYQSHALTEGTYSNACGGSCDASGIPAECTCPVDYPYCASTNAYCYRSALSSEWTNACAGSCTTDAPHCSCPNEFYYCATLDGYCYESCSPTEASYSNACGGSCDAHGSVPSSFLPAPATGVSADTPICDLIDPPDGSIFSTSCVCEALTSSTSSQVGGKVTCTNSAIPAVPALCFPGIDVAFDVEVEPCNPAYIQVTFRIDLPGSTSEGVSNALESMLQCVVGSNVQWDPTTNHLEVSERVHFGMTSEIEVPLFILPTTPAGIVSVKFMLLMTGGIASLGFELALDVCVGILGLSQTESTCASSNSAGAAPPPPPSWTRYCGSDLPICEEGISSSHPLCALSLGSNVKGMFYNPPYELARTTTSLSFSAFCSAASPSYSGTGVSSSLPLPPPPAASVPLPIVVLTLEAGGSVSDYADTLGLRQKIATAAGVSPSSVAISVMAASVIIIATITVPPSTTVSEVSTALSTSLTSADTASAALGVTIESVPAIEIPPGPSPPPPPELSFPMVAVIAPTVIVLVAAVGHVAYRSIRGRRSSTVEPGVMVNHISSQPHIHSTNTVAMSAAAPCASSGATYVVAVNDWENEGSSDK